MVLRTEAIVLRHLDFRETSQIVTLFTRELGKVGVLARGARGAKSPFGSALQPMAYVEAVLYHSPGREIQTLKEVAHVRPFLQLTRHLDRMAVGLRVIEFVHALIQPDEPHPGLFQLVMETLSLLDAVEEQPENLLLFFQLQLAGHLGFHPAVTREQVEALTDDGGSLVLESGEVIPGRVEGRGGRHASRSALRAFAILVHAPIDAVLRMVMTERVRLEVGALVDAYLHFHVEEAYPTRGAKIMGALLARRGA